MMDEDPEVSADLDATEPDESESTPLLSPADGVPEVCITAGEISSAATSLANGSGPFAIDAERASGFRYSNRAYLVQIRRSGSGTALIDPVNHGGSPIDAMAPVADALSQGEWVLHAADQDLPCLSEIGLRPGKLYDTELAGRLAGFERVNLAAMVQRLLGLQLMKGHGAADWSKRPLPAEWLNYAALDVEVLLELRDAIAAVLDDQDKTDWAAQEFEHLRTYVAQPTRRDRWRRTSGIHKVRNPQALSAVRELWTTRDTIARGRDIAPGRILPDAAIINAATSDPKTVDELIALPSSAAPSSARARKSGWMRWPGPETTPTRPRPTTPRAARHQRRGGPDANRKPRPASKPPRPAWPNCPSGYRYPPRTSSPRKWCAGCAGTGIRSAMWPPRWRNSSSTPRSDRGSGN